MREIEIKVRLQDKEGLLVALAGKGVALSEPVHQRDQVFGLPGEAGGDGNTVPWLRVRTETRGQGENETKRTLFTLNDRSLASWIVLSAKRKLAIQML